MMAILNDKCYKLEEKKSKYLVQMRSQAKERGIKVPEVHGPKKGIDSKFKTRMVGKESSETNRKY